MAFSLQKMAKEAFRVGRDDLEALKNLKTSELSTVVPHLVIAFHLEEIHKLVGEVPAFKEDGFTKAKDWSRDRGKVGALRTALGWLGYKNVEIRDRGRLRRWSGFQVGIPEEFDSVKVQKVCELSAPLRSKLERIYRQGKSIGIMELSGNSILSKKNVLSRDSGFVNEEGVTIQK